MSKYKGNYGSNSRANAAASPASSSASASDSSTVDLSSLVDLLDSYGFDLPAMLLLFWLLLFFLIVGGVNLYLTLVRRRQQQQQLQSEKDQKKVAASSSATGDQKSPQNEAKITTSSNNSGELHSTSPKRQPYALEEDEESRRWIEKVLDWLYRAELSSPALVNQLVDAWMTALTAKSAKLTVENGIHVEFVRLYRDKSSAIQFTNVKVESEVNGNVMITLKVICDRLVIAVRVHQSSPNSRDLSSPVGQHHQHQPQSSALYEIELNKFSALLKVVCKPEDSLFIVRFLERPETKVHINGPLTSSERNGFSPDLIINGVLNVLTSTLVDLSFANADRFPAFPARHTSSSFSKRTFDGSSENGSRSGGRRPLERKLFVTIARAHNLPVNQSKEGHEVYCTIEINEPREKRQTSSIREDASAPVWQDHFLFALNEQSREIHFEVFDCFQEKNKRTSSSTADACLGYGVANLLELRLNPSEKLTIPLQSRSNGYHGGGILEVELLLMEHKGDDSCAGADEHQMLNLPEKSEYSKMPAELAAYYRDLSSATTAASTLTSTSASPLMSSSGPTTTTTSTTFDSSLSASSSSLLTSTTATTATSSPGTSPKEGKATWRFSRLAKIASLGSLFSNFSSGSNSSSSNNGGGGQSSSSSDSQRKQSRRPVIGHLAKFSSNSSLANSSAAVTSNVPLTRQPLYHPSLLYSPAYPQPQQYHPHPHHRFSYQYQTASSLAMSLPVISPLIEVKRGSYPRDEYSNGPMIGQPKSHVPPIYVTQASQNKQQAPSPPNRKPSASLRWLRGNSLRGKGKKEPIELPPTVLYPVEGDQKNKVNQNHCHQPIIQKSGRTGSLEGGNKANETSTASTTPVHMPLRPSLTLSHLDSLTANLSDYHNKRSSVYSQLSFDSIDSRLSLVDDSAFEEADCAGGGVSSGSICLSPGGTRKNRNRPPPLPLPAPITLPQSPDTPNSFKFGDCGSQSLSSQQQRQQMYGRYAEKAKSDTHLYFTLDETSTEEALRENYDSKHQYFFGEDDLLPEEDVGGGGQTTGEETPPATPLKRNTNRRTSLYARFMSAKRATTKAASSPSSTVNSVKQRFRFRSSSKVPARLAGSGGGAKKSDEVPPVPVKRSSIQSSKPLSLHREPQYPPVPAPRMATTARLGSLVSASSVNLSSGRRDSASNDQQQHSHQQQHQHQSAILAAGFRRRSYKSATEMNSFMQRAQSSILPLAANSANSTSSHLDQYARSSLNTIKSDDHGHSSEGYGTDRGVTPDVPSSAGTLPPTRPESRSSQPRERSLIRTIRKRLSFTKRSKSVERSAPSSFRESSVGAGSSSGLNGNSTGGSALDRDERARSVPGSREPSAPRDNIANGKKQESFLSLASYTSFFAENSTLVLECTVNGEKKHYIVPYSKANKRKYRRRKGIKLHVFNDHLFVAQHVPSSQECQVCAKSFPMRIGKQGYVCRECGFLTHKQCHVSVESYCPANGAARLNFEVEGGDGVGSGNDTPRQMPSPVPEVRVIAPTEPFNEKEVF